MYTSLNAEGRKHVTSRLKELGLEHWNHQAVFDEIVEKCTDVEHGEHPRDYEIIQHVAKSGKIEYIDLLLEHFNAEG